MQPLPPLLNHLDTLSPFKSHVLLKNILMCHLLQPETPAISFCNPKSASPVEIPSIGVAFCSCVLLQSDISPPSPECCN